MAKLFANSEDPDQMPDQMPFYRSPDYNGLILCMPRGPVSHDVNAEFDLNKKLYAIYFLTYI